MALPQKTLDELYQSRTFDRASGWSSQMLMFAGTIFLITLFIYVGIVFGYRPYLNSAVTKLDNQIKTFSAQVPESDQKNIINFYSQLANTKILLDKHVYSSSLFSWLEKNTEANVAYTRLTFNIQNSQIVLSGIAKTVPDLSQQLQIFQERPEVAHMNVANVAAAQGGWQFDLTVFFNPNTFYTAPTNS